MKPKSTNDQCETLSECFETSQTRRQVLGAMAAGSAAVAGAVSLSGSQVLANQANVTQPRMKRLSGEQWSECIGQFFHVYDEQRKPLATLQLEEVFAGNEEGRDARPPEVRKSSVSLVFSASREIEHGTFLVKHSELGSTEFFLHPTKRGEKSKDSRYQVVIN